MVMVFERCHLYSVVGSICVESKNLIWRVNRNQKEVVSHNAKSIVKGRKKYSLENREKKQYTFRIYLGGRWEKKMKMEKCLLFPKFNQLKKGNRNMNRVWSSYKNGGI